MKIPKKFLIIFIAVVVLIFAVLLILSRQERKPQSVIVEPPAQGLQLAPEELLESAGVSGTEEGVVESSLKSLLVQAEKQNVAKKCTLQHEDELAEGEGVVFLADSRYRSLLVLPNKEDPNRLEINILSDGEWFYSWNSNQETGSKIKLLDLEGFAQDSTNQTAQAMYKTFDAKNLYNCVAWEINESYFTLPTGMEFKNITEDLRSAGQTSRGSGSDYCEKCDQMTGVEKSECEASCR